ncbi:MAG: efflux RND transporter periplasmic adaptor subunit, partial [Acidaminococcaceae bacterium]|nr:efflux RND transporter periplasmic adaptor subunit [Acidaminococcaceae bacterium]
RKKIACVVGALVLACTAGYYFFQKQEDQLVLYGNVDVRQVSLAFNSSERIERMLVEEGDRVDKNDLLAILESRPLELSIAKSEAAIEKQEAVVLRLKNGSRPEEIEQNAAKLRGAEADYENALVYKNRMKELYESSAISKQEMDNAWARYKAAAASVDNARETYRLSELGPRYEDIAEAEAHLKGLRADLLIQKYNLSQTKLYSPVNGVVRSRLQETGDMASPQKPVYLIALDDTKWVRTYISEQRLGEVKPGMEAEIFIDSFPDKPLRGQVGYISNVAEFTPKTVQTEELRSALVYEVRVNVIDENNILRMGMPATVKLQ